MSYPRLFKGTVEYISNAKLKKVNTNSLLDPAKYNLSLIIPAFNEEKRLESMLNDVFKVIHRKTQSERTYTAEILLVDDGSKDGTIKEYKRIVSTFGDNPMITFKLINLFINSGKGKAVSEVIFCF